MKVRRVGAGGARAEGQDEALLLATDRATAARLRSRRPGDASKSPKGGAPVLLVADRLPLRDGVLEELVDERADGPEAVTEGARVVRAGGKVILVADARASGGLAVVLGGLWKRPRRALAPADASAWLLGAGCDELTQTTPHEGLVVTEGRVRPRLAGE
jgi:hypothetical protein